MVARRGEILSRTRRPQTCPAVDIYTWRVAAAEVIWTGKWGGGKGSVHGDFDESVSTDILRLGNTSIEA